MLPSENDRRNTQLAASLAKAGEAKPRDADPQAETFEALLDLIEDFRSRLDDDHDVGARFATVEGSMYLRGVTRKASLVVFEGVDADDQEVVAIQHHGQLGVQLVKLRKLKPRRSAIGFTSRGR